MLRDLSHLITASMPAFPGDPGPEITPIGIFDIDGLQDYLITIGTHLGTHIDAPAHMLTGGKSLNHYPLERFIGRANIIDATGGFSLKSVQAVKPQPGDMVFFWTGLAQRFKELSYFESYPDLPEKIARYLVQQRISIVGFDTPSPDHEPYAIHKLLLAGDVLILENLKNLEALPAQVQITALPLNVALDGAPCRVIANYEPAT
jgi:arylformamidase